jgi:hypothetical protein
MPPSAADTSASSIASRSLRADAGLELEGRGDSGDAFSVIDGALKVNASR